MRINITARHIDLTPALADYVDKKLKRVAHHFGSVIRAQVVLTVEKDRHTAEVVAHVTGHRDFRANETAGDMYAAVDLLAEMFHEHMARQKERLVREGRHKERLGKNLDRTMPAEEKGVK